MFHNELSIGSDDLKLIYTMLMKAVNELRTQTSTKTNLSMICNGKSVNTHIAQVPARSVTIQMEDIEFYEWSVVSICLHAMLMMELIQMMLRAHLTDRTQ
jgi:hypothetical protein